MKKVVVCSNLSRLMLLEVGLLGCIIKLKK
jgi:hypothetical protein